MAWLVGKLLVGAGGIQTEERASNERQAQYKLGQVFEDQWASYAQIRGNQPVEWVEAHQRLRKFVSALRSGKWPEGPDGLNWFWSVPWGPHDRDCWVFWAKELPDGGSGGGGGDVVPLFPKGGREKELSAA